MNSSREEFLANLLCGAIEHCGYGFPEILEWHCPDEQYSEWHAVIANRYEDDDDRMKPVRVDLRTMARGLGIIRRAIVATDDDGTYLCNSETFERLYFGGQERDDLLLANRTSGEDGDYDVVGALAVLECALFGKVLYG